jgi:hypothetical protein
VHKLVLMEYVHYVIMDIMLLMDIVNLLIVYVILGIHIRVFVQVVFLDINWWEIIVF